MITNEIVSKIIDRAFPEDVIFDQILSVTLSFEGKYKPPTKSYEEPTNYGITQSTYNLYNASKKLSTRHVLYITPTEVKKIYYEVYYLKPKIHALTESVRGVVFDFYVNSPRNAVLQLQKLVNVFPDARIGNDTLSGVDRYIKSYGLKIFISAYSRQREAFYRRLVIEEPEKKENLDGWLKRTMAIEKIYGGQ